MPLGKRTRYAGVLARYRYAGPKSLSFRKKRTMPKMRPSKGILQKYNVHMYKRWANPTTYTTTSSTASFNQVYTLNDTVGASELTALYDQYKIVGVKVKLQLITNPDSDEIINNNTGIASTNWYPKVWYCRDYDNVATESVDDLRQRNNTKCKVMKPNQFVSIYLKPAVRNQIYLDGVTTATSPMWNQWIDCSNSTVPHYGLKLAFDLANFTPTQTWYFRAEYCYYLKFKNCR